MKRQTTNAMKCMQLLVRVQSQIQSRRIQMLENQALQRQSQYKNEKELESSIGKWALSQPVSFFMFDPVLDCTRREHAHVAAYGYFGQLIFQLCYFLIILPFLIHSFITALPIVGI